MLTEAASDTSECQRRTLQVRAEPMRHRPRVGCDGLGRLDLLILLCPAALDNPAEFSRLDIGELPRLSEELSGGHRYA
jgi:hypothetical protein